MAEENEKCRKTKIVRVGDQDAYVDLEVLTDAAFKGAQWQGPDKGNQHQETILGLAEDLIGTGGDGVTVDMAIGNGDVVTIHTKGSALFKTWFGRVERSFSNTDKNGCRDDHKRRLQFNFIDDEFLKEDGKPPDKAKEYKEAVDRTKDNVKLWLDVYIPKKVTLRRAKGNNLVAIECQNVWGSGNVSLPGSSDKTDPKGEHLRLDPYQAAINFGPDGLAVEFNAGRL